MLGHAFLLKRQDDTRNRLGFLKKNFSADNLTITIKSPIRHKTEKCVFFFPFGGEAEREQHAESELRCEASRPCIFWGPVSPPLSPRICVPCKCARHDTHMR